MLLSASTYDTDDDIFLILILGYILHLSIGINYYLNIIICIFGLYLCKFYISKFDNKKILILLKAVLIPSRISLK